MFWNTNIIYSWGETSMGNIRDEAALPAEVFRNILPAEFSKNKFECFVVKNH